MLSGSTMGAGQWSPLVVVGAGQLWPRQEACYIVVMNARLGQPYILSRPLHFHSLQPEPTRLQQKWQVLLSPSRSKPDPYRHPNWATTPSMQPEKAGFHKGRPLWPKRTHSSPRFYLTKKPLLPTEAPNRDFFKPVALPG